jgi:hypothetical protein
LTSADLRRGPERAKMAAIDNARDTAIRALDALNDHKETASAEYWGGCLAAALELVISDLRDGA